MLTILSSVFESIKFGYDVFFLLIKSVLVVTLALLGALFPTRRKSVKGQIVLITGAGHGIGKELAIQMSDLDCTVVCVDLDQESNTKTADFINARHDRKRAFPFQADVTAREQVMEISRQIAETIGPVDMLINNAGIMPPQPILSVDPEDIVEVINVNLLAHFWTVLAFLPAMVERGQGHVVAVSSLAGISGLANKAPYSASKFGVSGMMDALVEEIRGSSPGSGIKFTTVYPYFVDTRPDLPEHLHLRIPQLKPEFAAKEIIRAILEEQEAISIPRHLYFFTFLLRLLPQSLRHSWRDLFHTNVEPVQISSKV